jgi:hypothetical protein
LTESFCGGEGQGNLNGHQFIDKTREAIKDGMHRADCFRLFSDPLAVNSPIAPHTEVIPKGDIVSLEVIRETSANFKSMSKK